MLCPPFKFRYLSIFPQKNTVLFLKFFFFTVPKQLQNFCTFFLQFTQTASSWETFLLHGSWMSMKHLVRLHFWLMTTRLSGVLSSQSPVHYVVLDFCLSVSMTVPFRSVEFAPASCESGATPSTQSSHALWEEAWCLPCFIFLIRKEKLGHEQEASLSHLYRNN